MRLLPPIAAAAVALVLAACEDSPDKLAFVEKCEASGVKVDCGCFYDKAEEVLAGRNPAGVLAFMKVKNQYSAKQQKSRLESIVGKAGVTPLWRASMKCSG